MLPIGAISILAPAGAPGSVSVCVPVSHFTQKSMPVNLGIGLTIALRFKLTKLSSP